MYTTCLAIRDVKSFDLEWEIQHLMNNEQENLKKLFVVIDELIR
jgi:hypothetical protein